MFQMVRSKRLKRVRFKNIVSMIKEGHAKRGLQIMNAAKRIGVLKMSMFKKEYLAVLFVLSIIFLGCGGDNGTASIKIANYNVNDYVSLGEYKGIEMEVPKISAATDQEVENEINRRLESEAKYEAIADRDVVQKGDYVLINTLGKKEGVIIEGGAGNYEYYEVGSGGYIDEIENQLVGKKSGLPFDITVDYPKDYVVEDLAGQRVVFTITIKSINKKIVPVLNDEYVRSKSETSKTVSEYKEEVRKHIQESNEALLNMLIEQHIEQEITKNATVSGFPEGMIEKKTAEFKDYLQNMAKGENKSFKDYIKEEYNWDDNNYEDKLKEKIEADAKKALVLEAIEKKENLTMTKEEIDKAITEFAIASGYTGKEALLKDFKEDDVKSYVQQQKVMKWLIDNAKIVEVKEEAKQ